VSVTFVDTEGPIRAWLRAQSALAVQVGQRIFIGGTPEGGTSAPWLCLNRVGGAPRGGHGDVPEDPALIQFDCWGGVGPRYKAQVAAVSAVLVTALMGIERGTRLSGALVCNGATVEVWHYSPDPADGRARYIVDSRMYLMPA
jgi:hypothetical protein